MMIVMAMVVMCVRLVRRGMDDAGILVDRHGRVAMAVAGMLDFVAAGIAGMRPEDRDQPRENRADQGQKDNCLDHWRVNPSSD